MLTFALSLGSGDLNSDPQLVLETLYQLSQSQYLHLYELGVCRLVHWVTGYGLPSARSIVLKELGHPVLFSCFAVYGLDEHPDPRHGLLGHGTPQAKWLHVCSPTSCLEGACFSSGRLLGISPQSWADKLKVILSL